MMLQAINAMLLERQGSGTAWFQALSAHPAYLLPPTHILLHILRMNILVLILHT